MNYKNVYNEIIKDEAVIELINFADKQLKNMGYVLHDASHSYSVCDTINVLSKTLLFDEKEHYLSMISGYLHDIGNCISRKYHESCGADIAFYILKEYKLSDGDISIVCNAIKNHRSYSTSFGDKCSSVLYIADKTHISRSRVRKNDYDIINDIHDKINYAVVKKHINIEKEKLIFEVFIDE